MARRRRIGAANASGAAETKPGAPLLPIGDQALIRMYGQGLGDCFLIAFPRRQPRNNTGAPTRPVYVLIDCGVVAGTPGGPDRMRRIVRDIRESTRDLSLPHDAGHPKGHLDLLILTHEHWDHLSGFIQAREEWARIQVDALWMAWTEKEADPSGLPDVLKTILERQKKALAAIADRALQFGLADQYPAVMGLLAFLSDAETQRQAFGAAPSVTDAFRAAKGLTEKEQQVCCEPGEVRLVPGTDVNAYVLGPPRDEAFLVQADPSARAPETYEHTSVHSMRYQAGGRSEFNALATPFLDPWRLPEDADPSERAAYRDTYDRSHPFDPSVRVAQPLAEAAATCVPGAFPALASYYDPHNHWRRVDFDWLGAAESFALRADHLTNNTSLVLAFELPPARPNAERKVLLFVGDAQVGNWLSWDRIPAWEPREGATPSQRAPDIGDLLGRTVFYKVGHHGSHNATLKAKGVERMRADGRLTAFVPVSVPVARRLKDWCHMPLDPLLDALAERAPGRVVLPNGNAWPPVERSKVAAARRKIGLTVSEVLLDAKIREGEPEPVEGPVPLWVQIPIDY